MLLTWSVLLNAPCKTIYSLLSNKKVAVIILLSFCACLVGWLLGWWVLAETPLTFVQTWHICTCMVRRILFGSTGNRYSPRLLHPSTEALHNLSLNTTITFLPPSSIHPTKQPTNQPVVLDQRQVHCCSCNCKSACATKVRRVLGGFWRMHQPKLTSKWHIKIATDGLPPAGRQSVAV